MRLGYTGAFAVTAVWLGGSAAAAQDTARTVQLADRGPRFLSTPTAEAPSVDVGNAPVFKRRVTLELVRVPLEDALRAVGRQARVTFVLTQADAPVHKPVSVSATNITLRGALDELLVDTDLDVQLSASGLIAIVPRNGLGQANGGRLHQETTAIVGRVVDAITHVPLDQVVVRVEGLGLGAVTRSDGHYTIRTVPMGTYRATARRVGYTPLTTTVTLATDSAVIADFALVAAPSRLNEVVTTAVGDQRRYEVGNTISTINADSIAPTTPITSLTDLITSRAPGVEVMENSGVTGSGEAIRIRGRSSLVLSNDPILIVDGVRQDNAAGGDVAANGFFQVAAYQVMHPSPTRLNDLDFSDIASIDVLKGPAAATEYGTDAANGVIVITTKHGTAGRAQWKISAEQTASDIPRTFPDGYYSWGHTTDGGNTPVECVLVPVNFDTRLSYGITTGTCAVDSVTRWNPLNHSATSVFATGARQKYDLSASGGSDAVRYFLSGGLSNETGVVHMPPVFRELADTAGLGLPNAAFRPNVQQQRSVRANTAIRLGPTADASASASYLSTYQQTPNTAYLYDGALTGPALDDAAHYYGYAGGGYGTGGPSDNPVSHLSEIGSQQTDRVTGGLAMTWRPIGWFVGHATAGLDHGSQQNGAFEYPLANPAYQFRTPLLVQANVATDIYSIDVRGTATASVTQHLRAVTSGGVQMVDRRMAGQTGIATNITATNLTLNGSTNPILTQQGTRQATLGGYGEEELTVAGRLFLTGALRVDAGSGFGRSYSTAAYPKASVSWLAMSEGSTTVRVRGAFGESGAQPTNGAAQALYSQTTAQLGGTAASATLLNWPGNPNLRPERSEEIEGGIDLSAWGDRLTVELTGYSKTTRDALVNINLVGDVCCYTFEENIGKVRNTGLEGNMAASLLRMRWATWDIGINGSINHNTLVSLAPGVFSQAVYGFFTQYRQAPGYPLYGIWGNRVTYADANHDGILESSEVKEADTATYLGPSLPTREASVSTHVGLWRGAVTVGAVADYRGGYRLADPAADFGNLSGSQWAQNDRHAPLSLQARSVATSVYGTYPEPSPYAEDATFVRFRELSVTYAFPRSMGRALHVESVSLTGAVRNLALWTHYTGADPEATNTADAAISFSPTSNGYGVNNDIREDLGAVPLARYWVLRLNVGL